MLFVSKRLGRNSRGTHGSRPGTRGVFQLFMSARYRAISSAQDSSWYGRWCCWPGMSKISSIFTYSTNGEAHYYSKDVAWWFRGRPERHRQYTWVLINYLLLTSHFVNFQFISICLSFWIWKIQTRRHFRWRKEIDGTSGSRDFPVFPNLLDPPWYQGLHNMVGIK